MSNELAALVAILGALTLAVPAPAAGHADHPGGAQAGSC